MKRLKIRCKNKLLFLEIILVISAGCSVVRKAGMEHEKVGENTNKQVFVKRMNFLNCDENNLLFKGYAKYYEDSVLIITFLSKQGIIGGRIYIWKEKALIINRVDKKYCYWNHDNKLLEIAKKIWLREEDYKSSHTYSYRDNNSTLTIVSEKNKEGLTLRINDEKEKRCIKVEMKNITYVSEPMNVSVREKLDSGYKKVQDIDEVLVP